MLFAVLVIVVLGFSGIKASLNNFIDEAGGNRYQVAIRPYYPTAEFYEEFINPSYETIDKVRAAEQKYIADKTAAYAAQGLKFDPASIVSALKKDDLANATIPEQYRYRIDLTSPVMTEIYREKWMSWHETANNKHSDIIALKDKYNIMDYHTVGVSDYDNNVRSKLLSNFNSTPILAKSEQIGSLLNPGYKYSGNGIFNSNYRSIDDKLIDKYITKKDNLIGVPVVVSAYDLAELYGEQLGVETKQPEDKTRWLKDIRAKGIGFTYDVCYRNDAEKEMIRQAEQMLNELEVNRNNPHYQPHGIHYRLPTEPCGNVTIAADYRTEAEKIIDTKKIEEAKATNNYEEPRHYRIRFQVVGIINDDLTPEMLSNSRVTNVADYFDNLLSRKANYGNIGIGVIIPAGLYDNLPVELKIPDLGTLKSVDLYNVPIEIADQFSSGILEFKTLEDARAFINNETCGFYANGCNKPYEADQFGVNYLAINDINALFNRVMTIILPIILVLAVVIIWLMVSRIMTDSRHEIAVYRAVGAKRSDIIKTYFTYVAVLGVIIAVVALALGLVAVITIDILFQPWLTTIVRSTLSLIDSANVFSLMPDFRWVMLCIAATFVLVITVSCLAGVIPIIRNTNCNPIEGLKEE